jgi:hypothetical protein
LTLGTLDTLDTSNLVAATPHYSGILPYV